MKRQNKFITKPRKPELDFIIKEVFENLEEQYKISAEILNRYEFECRGNKIFIMTRQVKEFKKIRAVRKGILFAEKLGNSYKISDNIKPIVKL